jgi:hypothetical protein
VQPRRLCQDGCDALSRELALSQALIAAHGETIALLQGDPNTPN